jgi:hypothetical protein
LVPVPAKRLDISAVEAALDELLERYRQALRAVELLPAWGHMQNKGDFAGVTPQVDQSTSHFVVRGLVRMFLRSHVRSKLRVIAGWLEIERFAGGHMDVSASRRLSDLIGNVVRTYEACLAQGKIPLLGLLGWIWPIAVPILATYFTTLFAPDLKVAGVLVQVAIGSVYFAATAWFPLYLVVGSGGFGGKRLVLLGKTGYMVTDVMVGPTLHLTPMPEANTYEYENRLFRTLGLLKPEEFPWDIMLAPPALMSTALALAFFLLALALLPAATGPNLAAITSVVLFIVTISCVAFVRRLIGRELQSRRERNAC